VVTSIDPATWTTLLPLLVCPVCRRPLSTLATFDERNAVLGHPAGDCRERYPVIDDLPRLLAGQRARDRLYREHDEWFSDAAASVWFPTTSLTNRPSSIGEAVVARFDREWATFADVGTDEQSKIFELYFDLIPRVALGAGAVVLDAGCGAGRWAVQVASRGSRVVALDAGQSVELAHRNGRPWGVQCVQGDVTKLPFASASFDVVYSLGVLHHVDATEEAATELVRALRPGGHCLIYLYYALDNRGPVFRMIYRLVDLVRRVLSRSPQAVVGPISDMIAALVYLPLARTSRTLRRLRFPRLASALPLSSYADRSFRTMRNDSLDRFGTRLEKRFTRSDIVRLMERAGLEDVRVAASAPFWHAVGRRPVRS
jgi:SAM-dependent methyltransferase